ncbi:Rrf2 family transcriptional regulator [Candidatus Kuenenbacteria bacterium]|nr:Rrf2 family transcriptional regulator [Candidatus Kuenenbacteria bacterium]
MKFSTKAEYGLRAIVHLDKTGKKPVSLALIAKEEGLSLGYLERLFAKLKKAGLVKAEKGVNGGYLLAKSASKIKVLEIIEALEGSVAPYDCVDGKKICCECACKVHPVWEKLYKQVKKTLNSMTLSSIM